ncbi:MAG TPA: DEAD/DEAH box helicase [Verrucomicrobiae bacterium]|nr:DEAD/DEAH box helicase [Verrucomicrobiae bacterium]
MPFKQLGLSDEVVRGVQAAGYVEPTPIQLRAIPLVLSGKDCIGSAQTGTGKTAAFALPILTMLKTHGKCRCLVLEPTRELAAQVETAFRDYGRFTNLKTSVVFGGVGYGEQKQQLQRGVDIVVATPGRLLDLMGQGVVKLQDVGLLVLDEVDRMLDMGFLPDVRRIVERCPKQRQTMLFSATIPPEIERLAAWVLRQPEKIEIGISRSPAETVTHACYPVATSQKFQLLAALLQRTNFDSVLIFSRTKHGADKIAHRLKIENHSVAALHSNRTQRERVEALEGFKSGKYEVMVATDIAARGLDVEDITHVINYDVPQHPEDYVHRIGRTGRAQKVGDAFTLVTIEELEYLRAIERFIGQKIPQLKVENFNYIATPLFEGKQLSGDRRSVRAVRTMKGYSFSPSRRRR